MKIEYDLVDYAWFVIMGMILVFLLIVMPILLFVIFGGGFLAVLIALCAI